MSGGVERPVADRAGGHRGRISLPGFDGQVTVAQESTTVLAVHKQSGGFKTHNLAVKLDGLVQILGGHAGMLEIGGECGHWLGHVVLLCM